MNHVEFAWIMCKESHLKDESELLTQITDSYVETSESQINYLWKWTNILNKNDLGITCGKSKNA